MKQEWSQKKNRKKRMRRKRRTKKMNKKKKKKMTMMTKIKNEDFHLLVQLDLVAALQQQRNNRRCGERLEPRLPLRTRRLAPRGKDPPPEEVQTTDERSRGKETVNQRVY